MPEGDTIFRTARALDRALSGRTVTAFSTALAKLASVHDNTPLTGRMVERVEARGKWCLIHLSGDLILLSHMLMSGSWHIYRTGAESGRPPERWKMPYRAMRVMLTCREMQAVLFNAQTVELHTARSLERKESIARLGPDLLSSGFAASQGTQAFLQRMQTHPDDEVGVALLNQRVLAGLGNVYKSEVAFLASVHPFRQLRTLSHAEIERMVTTAERLMRANVEDGGSGAIVTYAGPRRTTHRMEIGERLWVYGRQGQPCRRCGGPISMRKQGMQARSTYWCANCQPWIAEGENTTAPVGDTYLVRRRKVGC